MKNEMEVKIVDSSVVGNDKFATRSNYLKFAQQQKRQEQLRNVPCCQL